MLIEVQRRQSTLRARMTLGTLLIVIIILSFGGLTWLKLKENFAQEKIQEAAAMRAKLLLPQLEPPLRATMNDVVPFYIEVGRERLKTLSPKLEAKVKVQADKLGQELEEKMNVQLQDFFNRLSNRASVELFKDFPGVAADNGARTGEYLKRVMVGRNDKLRDSVQQLYTEESKRIGQSMSKFPVPNVGNTDLETLQKKLLHELLMLADYEMTENGQQPTTAGRK